MKRSEFINSIVRLVLFGALTAVALITGNRLSGQSDCSGCPGKGICSGETDCTKFIAEK